MGLLKDYGLGLEIKMSMLILDLFIYLRMIRFWLPVKDEGLTLHFHLIFLTSFGRL